MSFFCISGSNESHDVGRYLANYQKNDGSGILCTKVVRVSFLSCQFVPVKASIFN
jgi:hypothetical protein